jgi:sugar phosphate isomerase/epimerase
VLSPPQGTDRARIVLHYLSAVPVDRFPELPQVAAAAGKPEAVEVGPGLTGERLPLPADIMPTGLAWRPNGQLVFCSLKGQVFEAIDSDRDGSEDQLRLLADGLPAPYGINTGSGYIDVSAKYALLRVRETGDSGRHIETIASGWGYTLDYHDWAVGLPRNERGEYFLGIPCQEDRRSLPGAHLHGGVLRLTPRSPTAEDPRRFSLTPISAGLRFPMGLALNREGDLFATDNQGNYKPFNELNHIRSGAFFGFPNFLDRGQPQPPRTPSSIELPHPWTRSVNGICFLDTPAALRDREPMNRRNVFGPLEGHLIGCEYNTRRLIRMTLERVGDTYQGAAYPFSVPPQDPTRGFLGPIVCAVSPQGVLHVGSIHDSGWGGGNNVGEIVRVPIDPDKLPCGIAEVRAASDGFTIAFFRPVDRALAAQTESYVVQSYRRQPTPAYGGPDLERRTEKVKEAIVLADGRRVALKLGELRQGFVYEFRLKNLAPDGGEFHPAEAHYTLQVVPSTPLSPAGRGVGGEGRTGQALFARDNLVAWCIVPFDSKKRSPEERAAVLKRLGFKRYSYDWRAEHLPTFEREIAALKQNGIELTAVWFPGRLDKDARVLLDVLMKHGIKTQLWVSMQGGAVNVTPEEQKKRVEAHAAALKPIAEEAARIGCTVALYNHGGWFGEPDNQLAILEALKQPNVGIVYNLHHGHDHLDRFPELLKKMKPHLMALNLNGMIKDGERKGKKVLPLGQGELDLLLLKTIRESGWSGPIGILGHTNDDAEERLKDNLDGLAWLLPQLEGKPAGVKPSPRTMAR